MVGTPAKKRLRRSGLRRFAYRLALKLGHVNVERMLRQISTRQLAEWRAYADLEPFDEGRADLRAATIVQALLNIHRGKGKPRIKIEDCLLQFRDDEPESPDRARAEVRQTLDLLVAIYGQKSEPPSQSVGR